VIVMVSNSTGLFHCLARETKRLGHLYSPGAQRGPYAWFPYALDNGAFPCWNAKENTFDDGRWEKTEPQWKRLLFWSQSAPIRPRWAIVPDVPGNSSATINRWSHYARIVQDSGIPLAVAVQDGMTCEDVRRLTPVPEVVAVGGSTEWKWSTVETWCVNFRRVHVLRCNSPERLRHLEELGVESVDGTGWNRGDRSQTRGLEEFCRRGSKGCDLWPHFSRRQNRNQEAFA
jgi:hypothetical protein